MKVKGKSIERFFVRLFKSTVSLICVLVMIALVTASPSLADDCGRSDRVSLPQCSRFVSYNKGDAEVFNLCSGKITVKLDISGASDKRIDIKPGYGVATNVGTTIRTYKNGSERINRPTTASCCPRYSQCSFPNDKPIDGSTSLDAFRLAQLAKQDSRFKGFQ